MSINKKMTEITPSPRKRSQKRRKTVKVVAKKEPSRLEDLIHAVKREHVIKSLSPQDAISFAQTSKKHASETKKRLEDLEELQAECKENLAIYLSQLKDSDASINDFITRVYHTKCPLEYNRAEFLQETLDSVFDNEYLLPHQAAFQRLASFQDWDYILDRFNYDTGFDELVVDALNSSMTDAEKTRILSTFLGNFAHELILNVDLTTVELLTRAKPYLVRLSGEDKKRLKTLVEETAKAILDSDMLNNEVRNNLATVRIAIESNFNKIQPYNPIEGYVDHNVDYMELTRQKVKERMRELDQ